MTVDGESQQEIQERLIFVLSAPRSGSTLLMRILNATSEIASRSEPHLLPPLAHLGYWDCVDSAPYDQLQAQDAMRDWVSSFEEGDTVYFDACRAYANTLYGQMLAQGGSSFFLDKTPANSLVLPFLKKLYPKAYYIVLTRHPAAIFASYVDSFFDGDDRAASSFNPILSRYIPALANFLADPAENVVHIQYEDLVQQPQESLRTISSFLQIPFQEQALEYTRSSVEKGLGDPLGVEQHNRPVVDSVYRWVHFFKQHPQAQARLEEQLKSVSDEQLAYFGTSFNTLWDGLSHESAAKKRKTNRFLLERKILIALRKDIHRRPHGAWVRSFRRMCDVLLRG